MDHPAINVLLESPTPVRHRIKHAIFIVASRIPPSHAEACVPGVSVNFSSCNGFPAPLSIAHLKSRIERRIPKRRKLRGKLKSVAAHGIKRKKNRPIDMVFMLLHFAAANRPVGEPEAHGPAATLVGRIETEVVISPRALRL